MSPNFYCLFRYVLMCIHFLQQREPAILPCLQVCILKFSFYVFYFKKIFLCFTFLFSHEAFVCEHCRCLPCLSEFTRTTNFLFKKGTYGPKFFLGVGVKLATASKVCIRVFLVGRLGDGNLQHKALVYELIITFNAANIYYSSFTFVLHKFRIVMCSNS